jgi:hypothetical protein
VTSVSRQGVSYTILDNQEFIDELRTGLYEIDLFLKVTNPDNARRKSKVFSVDNPRARRYSPKAPVLTADEDYDITLVKGASATWTSAGTTTNLSNFFPASGWTPVVSLRNYSGSRSIDLDSTSIVLNTGPGTLSFTVPYDKTMKALGMVDPGTWTLYATKTINNIPNIVQLASGNLQNKLYN